MGRRACDKTNNADYAAASHGPTPAPNGIRHDQGAQRGTTGRAAEKAQVIDNDDGVIVDYAVEADNPADAPQLAPAISRIAPRRPRAVAAIGYRRPQLRQARHDRDLEALGVHMVAIPRKPCYSFGGRRTSNIRRAR